MEDGRRLLVLRRCASTKEHQEDKGEWLHDGEGWGLLLVADLLEDV
ncbi:MAG: hypothetical protein MJZ41_08850 [Bacteroidaceae bacterium]|nr:hypothetical protein [Bacteroidaceae bacterium]